MNPATGVTLDLAVRPSEHCMVRTLDGESVLLNLESSTYFGLDPVGTRIWQLIERHRRLGDVLRDLLQEYEVEADVMERDLIQLVSELLGQGLVVRADV